MSWSLLLLAAGGRRERPLLLTLAVGKEHDGLIITATNRLIAATRLQRRGGKVLMVSEVDPRYYGNESAILPTDRPLVN